MPPPHTKPVPGYDDAARCGMAASRLPDRVLAGTAMGTVERELLRRMAGGGGCSDSGSSSASVPQDDVRAGSAPSAASLPRSERFSLSTRRLWNLLSEDCDPDLGGDDDADLLGDCRLDCDALDDALEYCRDDDDMAMGTERWAGDPTMKSLPGDVERLGPSDLEHSDTLRLRQDCGLEHSELRRDRFDL